MSTTQQSAGSATEASGAATVPMRFEVTMLPVADVDRAKAFYQRLGWRLDIDFDPPTSTRGVQFTPPGLAGVDPVRQGHDDDDRAAAGHAADRRRHRGRP